MAERRTIPRVPTLSPATDWVALRAEGLAHIQRLSGAIWTDHNTHDPGITTLELLAYALTDLAYRMGLPTVDLLTGKDGTLYPPEISGLMPAHEVLTTAPRTIADYRRLLMRIDGVRNAWPQPLASGTGEVAVYADCGKSELTLSPQNAAGTKNHQVPISGLWRVLADLEPDDRFGAMNQTALTHRVLSGPLKGAVLSFDVSAPSFGGGAADLAASLHAFTVGEVTQVPLGFSIDLTVTLGVFAPRELPCQLRVIEDRPRFDHPALTITPANLRTVLEETGADGIVPSFFEKQRRRAETIGRIDAALHAHRGLGEDYLAVDVVSPFLVGFCADIELAADADLEQVQARVYHAIETYLAPPVRYRTLAEVLAEGVPVETIFDAPFVDFTMTANGEPLFSKPGFVTAAELAATELRSAIHASDLINLIVDIPGVVAIRNLLLQAYDTHGLAHGASQSWTLQVPPAHQPVFFTEVAKLLFYRSGIPFRAQPTEFAATLAELRARARREVYVPADQVLPAPTGRFRNPDAFYPVQHDFPETYGVGITGLAKTESPRRIAQARQFKGYLAFFEQILGDYLGQLAALRRIYSLDPTLDRSWFSRRLTEIAGSTENWADEFLTKPAAYGDDLTRARWTETEEQFLDRRNRLLDHLIARFAERFADYATLQFRLTGDRLRTAADLISDKIDFLRSYPKLSRERGQGANVRPQDPALVWDSDNISGLERRVGRLSGFANLTRRALHCSGHFGVLMGTLADGSAFRVVVNGPTTALFVSNEVFASAAEAEAAARAAYLGLRREDAFTVRARQGTATFELVLTSGSAPLTGRASFDTEADATRGARAIVDRYDQLLAAESCNSEGMHLIEHILLRPRAANHALLPVCLPTDCEFCGEEDPYSFRVSVILPYWPERCRKLAFRAMVERMLREEAPAHVQVKVCWIDQAQMTELDALHRDWLDALRTGQPETIRLPAQRLITLLARLVTVYPAATLHDCDQGEDENTLQLGTTALGIF